MKQDNNQVYSAMIGELLEKKYVIVHRIYGNYQLIHEDLAQPLYKQDAD